MIEKLKCAWRGHPRSINPLIKSPWITIVHRNCACGAKRSTVEVRPAVLPRDRRSRSAS